MCEFPDSTLGPTTVRPRGPAPKNCARMWRKFGAYLAHIWRIFCTYFAHIYCFGLFRTLKAMEKAKNKCKTCVGILRQISDKVAWATGAGCAGCAGCARPCAENLVARNAPPTRHKISLVKAKLTSLMRKFSLQCETCAFNANSDS